MHSFSGSVLQILKQFGDLSEELEQIRRYAIFRATEIKKSLDKGEDVTPLPGNEDSVDKSGILGSANSGEHLCGEQLSCFIPISFIAPWIFCFFGIVGPILVENCASELEQVKCCTVLCGRMEADVLFCKQKYTK